jgi:hypothetical protein
LAPHFSIGAVTFDEPLLAALDMMAKADELMYSVKLSGRNRIEHSVLQKANPSGRLVRCSKCRTSFAASSDACPICGGLAMQRVSATILSSGATSLLLIVSTPPA